MQRRVRFERRNDLNLKLSSKKIKKELNNFRKKNWNEFRQPRQEVTKKTQLAREKKIKIEMQEEERKKEQLKLLEQKQEQIAKHSQVIVEEAENRAALQWLRVKQGETNSKRLERRLQFEKEDLKQKQLEKDEQIKSFTQQKQEEHEKYLKQVAQTKKQKELISKEFGDQLGKASLPELENLATKFGIDIAAIKEKAVKSTKRSLSPDPCTLR